jgi:hypothetical protein
VLPLSVAISFALWPRSSSAATPVSARANQTAGTNLVEGGRFAGNVLALVEAAGRLYLGGEFTGLRSPGADGGVLDGRSGAARVGFPRVGGGQVRAALADGAGGWYVAGSFTEVDGQPRPGVARILSDGALGVWNPDVSPPGTVKALAGTPDGRVYLGGDFTAVGGLERFGLAAVDGGAGTVEAGFVPEVGGVVRALAMSPDGARLYAGGRVDPGGGEPRRGLAALDAGTGAAVPWNPEVIGRVDALLAAPGGSVYAAGDFTRAGGAERAYLARLDPANGAADGWAPAPDGPVAALALSADGGRLFVGGEFTVLAGRARRHLAAVDTTTGAPVPGWETAADAPVLALASAGDGSRLYAGGAFTQMGSAPRLGLAALDPASGLVDPAWQPDGGGTISTLSVSGPLVLAGGRFDAVVERSRAHLAALDVGTGAVDTGFATEADDVVRALVLSRDGGRLFVGGDFATIGGQPRLRLAALDLATGAVDPAFAPPVPNGAVRALALSPDGTTLYLGGAFNSLATPSGEAARPGHLAAVDARSGALLPWSPPADTGGAFTGQTGRPTDGVAAEINTLLASADGTRVYAGGTFVDIAGRAGLISLDAAQGEPTPWQAEMDRPVNSIAESPTGAGPRTVYVATGGFGGTVQAFTPLGRAEPVWLRRTDGDATGVVVSAGTVYLAGHFDYVCEDCGSAGGPGDDFRRHLAAFGAGSGELDPWAPTANTRTGPYCAALGAAHLYVGGEFTRINEVPQPGVAQFPGVP